MLWPKPKYGTSYRYGGWGDTEAEALANRQKVESELEAERVVSMAKYKPEVTNIFDDGESVCVRWQMDNGEQVSAVFTMQGWTSPPLTVRDRLLSGESLFVAPKGGAVKRRRRPARAKTPRS